LPVAGAESAGQFSESSKASHLDGVCSWSVPVTIHSPDKKILCAERLECLGLFPEGIAHRR